jgi:hypothetical protein
MIVRVDDADADVGANLLTDVNKCLFRLFRWCSARWNKARALYYMALQSVLYSLFHVP